MIPYVTEPYTSRGPTCFQPVFSVIVCMFTSESIDTRLYSGTICKVRECG